MHRDNTYTAHQPLLLPAIYMANRLAHVKGWARMVETQFAHNSGQNTCNLLDRWGKKVKFTLPVTAGRKPLDQIYVADPKRALPKFYETLRHLYSKAAYWPLYGIKLELLLACEVPEAVRLIDLTASLDQIVLHHAGIEATMYEEHWLGNRAGLDASAWIAKMGKGIERCFHLAGSPDKFDHIQFYLCGDGSLNHGYLKREPFEALSIECVPQNFTLSPYTRFAGTKAVHSSADATVSLLDPLLHVGPAETKRLINAPCT